MINKNVLNNNYYCEYCGTNLGNEVDVCPICGSLQNIFREDKYKWRDYYMQDEDRPCDFNGKGRSKELRKESYYSTLNSVYKMELKWFDSIKRYIDEKYDLIDELSKYNNFDKNDYNEFKNIGYKKYNKIRNFPNYWGICILILSFFLLVGSGNKSFILIGLVLWTIFGMEKYIKSSNYIELESRYKKLEQLDDNIKNASINFANNVVWKRHLNNIGDNSLIYSVMKECGVTFLEAGNIVNKDIIATRKEHFENLIDEYLISKGVK